MIAAPRLPKLYPKQKAALCDPARYVCIEASTKSGKTAGAICWLIGQAWNKGREGQEFWWIAPVYQQARIAFRRTKKLLGQWARPGPFTWEAREVEMAIEILGGQAGRLRFQGSDKPDTLYGEDVYACVIDEASRCKEDAWHAVRSTLTATRGPIRIIGNVRGRQNWAWRMARRAENQSQPDMSYHRLIAADAVEAGILDSEEVEDARRQLPEDVFRQLYLAEPADDQGNPFGAAALRAVLRGSLSSKPARAYGVDLAKYQDWTVICGLDEDGNVCCLERFQRDWKWTTDRIAEVCRTHTMVDSTGVGDPIVEELQRRSRLFEGFKFSLPSKQQLMEGLAAAIHQKGLGVPDGWLFSELSTFEYQYVRGGVRYSAPEGLTDDGVYALGLANKVLGSRNRFSLGVRVLGDDLEGDDLERDLMLGDRGWI